MFAEIITIGDELLIGQVIDTNSAWMGQELNKIGIEVLRIVSIRDREKERQVPSVRCRQKSALSHLIRSISSSTWYARRIDSPSVNSVP